MPLAKDITVYQIDNDGNIAFSRGNLCLLFRIIRNLRAQLIMNTTTYMYMYCTCDTNIDFCVAMRSAFRRQSKHFVWVCLLKGER